MPQRRFPHCSVEEKPRRRGAVPLGVKLYANGFRSEKAAKLAGEKALRELPRWYCQRAERSPELSPRATISGGEVADEG